MRKFSISALSLATLLTLGGVAAAPAQAATSALTVGVTNSSPILGNYYFGDSGSGGCGISGSGSQLRYQTYQINITAADLYTFNDLTDSPDVDLEIGVYPLGAFNPASPSTGCISTADDPGASMNLGAGSYTLVALVFSGHVHGPVQSFSLSGSGSAYLGAAVADAGNASAIPSWMQAYARHSAEACKGSWGASWQQWPNGGQGGWVCTRTIASLA